MKLIVFSLAVVLVAAQTIRAAPSCDNVDVVDRFDCAPGKILAQSECEARGCCWQPSPSESASSDGPPTCFYGQNYTGLRLINTTHSLAYDVYQLELVTPTPYPNPFPQPRLEVYHETYTRLHVKLHAPGPSGEELQWVPPVPVRPAPVDPHSLQSALDFRTLNTAYDNVSFTFQIVRRDDEADVNVTLFDTNVLGPLIFTEQFMEIHTKLAQPLLYGLGERNQPFQRYVGNWTHYAMWTLDNVAQDDARPAYGTQPFYMSFDSSGRAYGVLFFNSNAMDVIMRPNNQLTWRAIGGILDLYFFAGPTPEDVVRQLTDLVGKPHLPPYWALGYQLSRWGFISTDGMRTIMQRNIDAGIPIEAHYNGHDYMNNSLDFTTGGGFADMKDYVNWLHSGGRYWLPLIDPQISATEPAGTYPPWDTGLDRNVFVRTKNGSLFYAVLWTGTRECWLDFTHPNMTDYWSDMFQYFNDQWTPFDGAWIDVNEPSNFINGSIEGCDASDSFDNPPFTPDMDGFGLTTHTFCASAKQSMSSHYNVHNLYAHTEAAVTQQALLRLHPGQRPYVLTRSNFLGTGHYAASWSGDYLSTWQALKQSITYTMNFNLFGMPLVGADICGFQHNTNEELCIRWHQVGVFYPLARNNNNVNNMDQDPAAFSATAQGYKRAALETRYRLLPYLHTLLVASHINGSAVARPLLYNFPNDVNTYTVDDQFMIGDALMISPILEAGSVERAVYLPSSERWFDYFYGREIFVPADGSKRNFSVPLSQMSVFQRGGTIIPHQHSNLTTKASRLNPFYIQAAMDNSSCASGELIWDDGISYGTYPIAGETNGTGNYSRIKFCVNNNTFYSSIERAQYRPEDYGLPPMTVDFVLISGFTIGRLVESVQINGQPVVAPDSYIFDAELGTLFVLVSHSKQIMLLNVFNITWTLGSA